MYVCMYVCMSSSKYSRISPETSKGPCPREKICVLGEKGNQKIHQL